MSDLRERLAEALAEAMSGYIDNGESIHLDMSAGKGVLERLAQNGWHLAQTEYSGMIERLQDALERERKRVEHYMTKEADAEATIQRLREALDLAYQTITAKTFGRTVESERAMERFILRYQALADTAPEGERQVIDTPQRCGVCSHRWTHCQCNPQRTAPERA